MPEQKPSDPHVPLSSLPKAELRTSFAATKIPTQTATMDETTEMEIDPAIAEAMGFSAFGSGKKGKSKMANEGFIDPDISSNRTSQRETHTDIVEGNTHESNHETAKAAGVAQDSPVLRAECTRGTGEAAMPETGKGGEDEHLKALRYGIRNAEGHLAIFLPSFLEDPWKDLRSRRKDSNSNPAQEDQPSPQILEAATE